MSDTGRDGGDAGLLRTLGAWGAGAFVVTNMVGSGIFTVPAFVRVATGSALASLGVWAAGGLLGLCGALCYAELATRLPGAGGEYRYLERIFGPVWGFLSGWISFIVGFSAAIAASSLGVMAYLAPLVPGWDAHRPLLSGLGISQGAAAAATLVAVLTLVHCLGVRSSGRFQATLAVLVLSAIGVLVVAGLSSGRGDAAGIVATAVPRSSWWVALLQVSYAYAGWNAAAYMAGEVRRPGHNLPRALVGGTLFVTVAYLALNALFFYAMPQAEWEAQIAVGQAAAEALWGRGGSLAVSGVIALCMFGSVSAMTAVGPRVYFAMAEDGLAPAVMARLGRGRAPVVAIAVQGALAALLALTGAFETLLVYIGSALLLFSGLTVLSLFRARRRGIGQARAGVFRTPLFPVPALVFLGMTLFAWGYGLAERPLPTGAALATMLVGAGVYAVGRRQGWLRGRGPEAVQG